jgi:uncharacterized protein (TIGR03067 family)
MTLEDSTTPLLNLPPPVGDSSATAPVPSQSIVRKKPSRLGRVMLVVLSPGICVLAVWYWGIREPEPKDDLGRFQGDWKLVIGGRNEEENEDEPPRTAVRITGDRWQYLAAGREGKAYRIKLNETADPKEIEMILLDAEGNPVGGYRSYGVYTIDRKTARVLVLPVNKPRPTDFNHPDSVVWELSKVKLQLPAGRK